MARKELQEPADPKRRRLIPRHLPTRARGVRSFAKVMDAAAALIERDGLDHATTRRIALAAGLSVGAVYEYFPNKESIALRIGSTWMERIRHAAEGLHPDRSGIGDLPTYINETLAAAAGLYREQPGLLTVVNLIGAIPELREVARRHDETMIESMGGALRTFAPGAAHAEIDAIARCLQAMIHALMTECFVTRTADPVLMLPKLHAAVYALIVPLMLPGSTDASAGNSARAVT